MIKGKRVYQNFDDAKLYVLARREEMRQAWESKRSRTTAKVGAA